MQTFPASPCSSISKHRALKSFDGNCCTAQVHHIVSITTMGFLSSMQDIPQHHSSNTPARGGGGDVGFKVIGYGLGISGPFYYTLKAKPHGSGLRAIIGFRSLG